jgi:hypothetical protein
VHLDALSSVERVGGGVELHLGRAQNIVADLHHRAIEDNAIKVHVEPLAHLDVRPVVAVEGRFDVGTLATRTQQFLQQRRPLVRLLLFILILIELVFIRAFFLFKKIEFLKK